MDEACDRISSSQVSSSVHRPLFQYVNHAPFHFKLVAPLKNPLKSFPSRPKRHWTLTNLGSLTIPRITIQIKSRWRQTIASKDLTSLVHIPGNLINPNSNPHPGPKSEIPLVPTVKEELLLYTGAPELVVQNWELYSLDGRCCTTTIRTIRNREMTQFAFSRQKQWKMLTLSYQTPENAIPTSQNPSIKQAVPCTDPYPKV